MFAVESDGIPFVERQAHIGGESAGEQLHPVAIVEPETAAGVGQRKQPLKQTKPVIQHLGIAGALGWAIVKQHDALSQRHGTGRPGDDRLLSRQLDEPKKPQPVDQHGDVTAGDYQSRGVIEDGSNLGKLALESGVAARGVIALESVVDLGDPSQVLPVEIAHCFDRGFPLGLQQLGVALAMQQLPCRLEGEVETVAVELVHLPQSVLARTVTVEEIRLGGEGPLATPVQPQVDHRPAEIRPQLLDFGLSLLPARGDDGDLTFDAQTVDRGGERRLQALGSEQSQGTHSTQLHTLK